MSAFSVVLQSEYRTSLQSQCDEKEKNYKQQIEKLDKMLSETKNKLFEAQVKCVKKTKKRDKKQRSDHHSHSHSSHYRDRKEKEDRKRSSSKRKEHKRSSRSNE